MMQNRQLSPNWVGPGVWHLPRLTAEGIVERQCGEVENDQCINPVLFSPFYDSYMQLIALDFSGNPHDFASDNFLNFTVVDSSNDILASAVQSSPEEEAFTAPRNDEGDGRYSSRGETARWRFESFRRALPRWPATVLTDSPSS
jgi:hypothetical protein